MLKRLLMLTALVLAFGLVGGTAVLGSTIEIGITDEDNDAEEDINPSKLGEVDAGSSDLEMPYEDTGMGDPQFAGVRYELAIGKGVTITGAWILFQVDELKDGSLPVNLIIEGELNPNPAPFAGGGPGTFDISTRPTTVAQVKWSVDNWETVGDRGPAQTTPNLAPILQELIDQPAWANGNAVVLIFRDDPDNPSQGNRVAEAGPGDDSATLIVEFGGDPFLQDSGPDGIISIEAENFHNSFARGAHAWEVVGPNDGFTGVAGVQALPNDGTNADLDQAISPSLDYEIALLRSGTYYVWLRAYGASGSDDSTNIGLDGQPTDTADRIDNFDGVYQWTNRTRDPERAFLDIGTGGVHTLNLWMREDGAIVDKIVLTTNPDYVPEGDGPPESGRGFPVVAILVSPADGAIELVDPVLEWLGADAAVSHQVYLSTDTTIDANDLLGDITETMRTVDVVPGTTYYWRVDEVTADGTVNEGALWSFATLAIEAHFPMPADGSVWQALDGTLDWAAGLDALVRDLFLSTDRALVEARDPSTKVGFFLSLPTHDPGPLEPGTKYYWAVDEFDSTFTAHAGPIWSFTTMDPAVDANVKSWNIAATAAAPAYQDLHVADGVYDIGQFGGEVTYEFIVRSDPCETEASMALIGRRGFGDTQVGLKYEQWNNTGTYGATIFGVVDLDFGVPTAPGEYTHLVFVSSEAASTTTLYVNGVEAGVVDRAISMSGIVGIGYGASAEDGSAFFDDFDGSIFGVAIYDEALSAATINDNATAFFTAITAEWRVSAGTDDAEERVETGAIDLGSSDLEITEEGSPGNNQLIGMRFNNVSIPQGAIITSAYVQFHVDETYVPGDNRPGTKFLRGEAVDNAATFSAAAFDISSRPITAAEASWDWPFWLTTHEEGPDQQTSDIAAVIQEIVDRPGWSAGNSLVLIITGSGENTAESFNGEADSAALLHISLELLAQPVPLTATLTGAAAGTGSTATGSATFQPNADGTAIGYVLSVTGLENTTMAHIHVSAEPGANGGVVVWLFPAGPPPGLQAGSFTGVLGEGDITADSLAGSLAGQSLDALMLAIQEGRAYVNVHTQQFGGGEIRGQLE
ncbi:MAG: CHRD domain-containing protein [Planctomycetes bacterium]|nr:CHRD domain-containing protein [Planctomycetota bacterium]